MRNVSVIGIDIAKNVFHICGVDERGAILFKRKLRRGQVLNVMQMYSCCAVRMEACGGAHYWGRELIKLGFEVKLIAPQFVKPFIKSNKNDEADAEAICEASQRPTMRFCEVKSVAQQEIQHLHRLRERAIINQTALTNELRGILLEYGIALPKGKKGLSCAIEAVEHMKDKISKFGEEMIFELLKEIRHLAERVSYHDKKLTALSKAHPVCQRLQTIPGVGPIISSAVVAAVSDPSSFKNGRQFAAWLGLVPKQHSTGGKPKLLGISKRGDVYIRKQLIHGARSVLYLAHKKKDKRSIWANDIKKRRGWNKAAVAVANKNARTIWALLQYETNYKLVA